MKPTSLFLGAIALSVANVGVIASLNPDGAAAFPLPLPNEIFRPLAPKAATPATPVALAGWAKNQSSSTAR